jgi:hypothetical protein
MHEHVERQGLMPRERQEVDVWTRFGGAGASGPVLNRLRLGTRSGLASTIRRAWRPFELVRRTVAHSD